MALRFRFAGSGDVRKFAFVSPEFNRWPRGLEDEARGPSGSESSTIAASAIREEMRRFCFVGKGDGDRSLSLPLASGSADTLVDALESERVVVNGKR